MPRPLPRFHRVRNPTARRTLAPPCLLALLLLAACPRARAQSLVIEHVTVIDATGRPARPDSTVVVERDRIVSVRPSRQSKLPHHAVIIEGAGKFLIPGLWDMHVHGASDERAPWSHLLFIANGIVGVRDMSGPPDAHAWRAAQASNSDPSPAIYLGSPIVDGPNPVWPDSLIAADEAQGRAIVDQQQQRGADFIKVYSRLPRNVYFAIADEAAKRGIPFEGHVPESVTAAEASRAGQRSIEHLTRVADACSSEAAAIDSAMQQAQASFRAPGLTVPQKVDLGKNILSLEQRVADTFDAATAHALFALFAKNRTWQCPTLTLLHAQIDDPLPAQDPRLNYLSGEVRAKWNAGFYPGVPAKPRAAIAAISRRQFQQSLQIVGLMDRAGVPILAGTDTMNPQCYPGFGLHDELAFLVDAGLSPLAALQAATRNAAQFMGKVDQSGTIEAGKIANLVLLNRNPLADIHNTRTIEAVVLNGQLYNRHALDAMLAKAQLLANRQDDAPRK